MVERVDRLLLTRVGVATEVTLSPRGRRQRPGECEIRRPGSFSGARQAAGGQQRRAGAASRRSARRPAPRPRPARSGARRGSAPAGPAGRAGPGRRPGRPPPAQAARVGRVVEQPGASVPDGVEGAPGGGCDHRVRRSRRPRAARGSRSPPRPGAPARRASARAVARSPPVRVPVKVASGIRSASQRRCGSVADDDQPGAGHRSTSTRRRTPWLAAQPADVADDDPRRRRGSAPGTSGRAGGRRAAAGRTP